MDQTKDSGRSRDRGLDASATGKAWVRPTMTLLAASSAEAGGGPLIDGGDVPAS